MRCIPLSLATVVAAGCGGNETVAGVARQPRGPTHASAQNHQGEQPPTTTHTPGRNNPLGIAEPGCLLIPTGVAFSAPSASANASMRL